MNLEKKLKFKNIKNLRKLKIKISKIWNKFLFFKSCQEVYRWTLKSSFKILQKVCQLNSFKRI